jgi:hypothetical protein
MLMTTYERQKKRRKHIKCKYKHLEGRCLAINLQKCKNVYLIKFTSKVEHVLGFYLKLFIL